jgi:hypothetical protein
MTLKITIVLLVVFCVLATTIEAKKTKEGRKNKGKKNPPQVQIVNGEEENSDRKCAKVCSGTTGRNSTKFVAYNDHTYVDVDMSECGFKKIPSVVTSVEGKSKHWRVGGASSVYGTTLTGFRVYLYLKDAGISRSNLNGANWNIDWIAVGFTC